MAKKSAARAMKVERATVDRISSVSDRKPHKSFDAVEDQGTKAHELALDHRAELESRLSAGLIDGLGHDVELLRGAVPDADQAHDIAKTATKSKVGAIERAYLLVSAVHNIVSHSDLPLAVQRDFGVGSNLRASSQSDVRRGIKTIVDAATRRPAEARSAGILPADLAALRDALPQIDATADDKDRKTARAPAATKVRNQTAQRVLAAVRKISAAGELQFAQNPVERAKFAALLGLGTRKAKKKGGEKKQGE